MKTPSNELFELIKSLTKNEKRYFKRFAQLHVKGEENNYIHLFDVIEKQKEYDEIKIKAKFRGSHFLSYLPTAKNHLYKLILKSLELYSSESSLNIQMNNMVNQIEILFGKKLYHHSLKMIKKTKELGERHENFSVLIRLYQWERLVLSTFSSKEKERAESRVKELDNIQKYRNQICYRQLENEMFSLYYKWGVPKNRKELLPYDKFMTNTLLKDNQPLCKTSTMDYLNTHYLYFFIINDPAKCYLYAKRAVDLLEQNPSLIVVKPRKYIISVYNLSLVSYNYEELTSLATRIKAMPVNYRIKIDEGINELIFLCSNAIELALYNKFGEFEKAINLINRISKDPRSLEKLTLEFADFQGEVILAFFGAGNYKEALKWFNIIMQSLKKDTNSYDNDVLSKLIFLTIQYELKNESLESYVGSTLRFLLKRKELGGGERKILHFFNDKNLATYNKGEIKRIFSELLRDLNKIKKDPFSNKIFEVFDFVSWAESKVTGETFAEVVKRKAMLFNK